MNGAASTHIDLDEDEDEDHRFWSELTRGSFVVRRCQACGAFDFPPSPLCWRCGAAGHDWVEVPDGTHGTVYTWTVCYRSILDFARLVPYAVVIGALPEYGGVRVVAGYVGDHDRLEFGGAVQLATGPVDGHPYPYSWRLP